MGKIYPNVFDNWTYEELLNKNTLITNGLVNVDPSPPFAGRGKIFTVPYHETADHWGDSTEIVAATTTTTSEAVSDYEIITGSIEKQHGIKAADYDLIRQGDMGLISSLGKQYGYYWSGQIDKTFKKVLDAIFDTTAATMADNQYDNTAHGNLKLESIIRACKLLGQSASGLDSILMGTDIFTQLQIDNAVYDQAFTTFVNGIAVSGTFPAIYGKKIIINDVICAATDGVYPVYLAGSKPLYLGYQKAMRVEELRTPNTGGGLTELFSTVDYGVAVNGVSYTGSSSVTETLLGTAASWTKKWATENIKLVQILTTVSGGA
jgi:hypothetical protein